MPKKAVRKTSKAYVRVGVSPEGRVRIVRKPPMTYRQALAVIDRILAKSDENAAKLWDVLTALRGPDHDDLSMFKGSMTVPIRRAAFPRTARNTGQNLASFGEPSTRYEPPALDLDEYEDAGNMEHFLRHMEAAALALGLPERK